MKSKLLFILILLGSFMSIQAQDRLQVGVNVFNSFLTFPSRLEMSFQLKNDDENSKINPVLIVGLNSGKSFMTNTKNTVDSKITHQYANKSQYIKAGIDLITKRKEENRSNYAQFLVGYSNNTAINKVTLKGNYYDDFHYNEETKFDAILVKAWYMVEFNVYKKFIGSVGAGISSMKILSNSNPEVPISEVGGGALFVELKNNVQNIYITPSLKFSIHYSL